eukprot:gnl/Dysnectes_brevis/7835_a13526_306.p1 GENE.gnl/Dysnectes_brevis/7835_a13526_306~~gnl/Dysnectes_brevis/7835_a13526_306.p1  ORF type:complete len:360 (+),score=28.53 gnl/Dysnectes_brevis/7835_a13526_306:211-1290(+)
MKLFRMMKLSDFEAFFLIDPHRTPIRYQTYHSSQIQITVCRPSGTTSKQVPISSTHSSLFILSSTIQSILRPQAYPSKIILDLSLDASPLIYNSQKEDRVEEIDCRVLHFTVGANVSISTADAVCAACPLILEICDSPLSPASKEFFTHLLSYTLPSCVVSELAPATAEVAALYGLAPTLLSTVHSFRAGSINSIEGLHTPLRHLVMQHSQDRTPQSSAVLLSAALYQLCLVAAGVPKVSDHSVPSLLEQNRASLALAMKPSKHPKPRLAAAFECLQKAISLILDPYCSSVLRGFGVKPIHPTSTVREVSMSLVGTLYAILIRHRPLFQIHDLREFYDHILFLKMSIISSAELEPEESS